MLESLTVDSKFPMRCLRSSRRRPATYRTWKRSWQPRAPSSTRGTRRWTRCRGWWAERTGRCRDVRWPCPDLAPWSRTGSLAETPRNSRPSSLGSPSGRVPRRSRTCCTWSPEWGSAGTAGRSRWECRRVSRRWKALPGSYHSYNACQWRKLPKAGKGYRARPSPSPIKQSPEMFSSNVSCS